MSAVTRDWWLARARELRADAKKAQAEVEAAQARVRELEQRADAAHANAQGECPGHVDNGGMFFGTCIHCGAEVG